MLGKILELWHMGEFSAMEMGTPEIPAACHARIAKCQGTSWVDSKWSRNSSTEVTASWRKVDDIWIFLESMSHVYHLFSCHGSRIAKVEATWDRCRDHNCKTNSKHHGTSQWCAPGLVMIVSLFFNRSISVGFSENTTFLPISTIPTNLFIHLFIRCWEVQPKVFSCFYVASRPPSRSLAS